MSRNEKIAIEMLDEIDRARSGSLPFSELEYKLWRLLDSVDSEFPRTLAAQIENLVLDIQHLQRENIVMMGGRDPDENRGVDALFNQVTGALGRYLL